MAVANAWAMGQSAMPLRQFRHPFSSLETNNHFSKKTISFNLPEKFQISRSKDFDFSCRCSSNPENTMDYSDRGSNNLSSSSSSVCSSSSSSLDWDWNRWTRHFSETEWAENCVGILKLRLDYAIEGEDFQEAANLKKGIAEMASKDAVAEIMSELKIAIHEERYRDASRLCRSTGSGLVGWWVGYSKDLDDPFGRLIQITPGTGRFIGKCYSPRQLITSSPGTPVFEIFVVKDVNEEYNIQVAFLKPVRGNSANSSSSSDKSTKGPSAGETENDPVIDVKFEESEVEKDEGKNIDLEAADEEGMEIVINFLKEKIPEMKVKAISVDVADDGITEDSIKELIEKDYENETSDGIKEEANDIESNQVGDSDTTEYDSDLDIKLNMGGALHNKKDSLAKDEFVRVPAHIVDMERDSFVLHIPGNKQDDETEENIVSKVNLAAIAAQGVSKLMPPEVAKAFWSLDKVSPKVTRVVRELVKLAVRQAQKRNTLSEYTNLSRITTPNGDLDPFNGLYIGTFGPYGPEIVQLRRKYGNWNEEKSSDIEFFEYVEAVKLTGDMNVPAGEVTFRAKIGKGNRLANQGKLYQHELGVVASYRGQGRFAEIGFRNPKWVEGELFQLDGRSFRPYNSGADLGFLYAVPEETVVLFSRLKLPE